MKNKFLVILAAALAFVGCRGTQDEPTPDVGGEVEIIEGAVSLTIDRSMIQSNGSDYATLRLYVTDANGMVHDVTEDADLYVSGDATPLASSQFTTTTPADYEIYAIYGLAVSDKVKVTAVDGLIDLPEDKGGSEFAHRILLVQHTGTDCPNCPRLMTALKALSEDSDYASRYYHVASHSYNNDDPAYSNAAVLLSSSFCSGYYPDLTYNLSRLGAMEDASLNSIKSRIDELQSPYAAVGISASVTHKDGKLYINAEVKSVVQNDFRLAIWVLEDEIYGRQSGATDSWQNTHENALRAMYGSGLAAQIYGESIGKLKAEQKVKRIFSMDCNDGWNIENCKVLLIVTSPRGENFELENSIVCPVGESVEYAYN